MNPIPKILSNGSFVHCSLQQSPGVSNAVAVGARRGSVPERGARAFDLSTSALPKSAAQKL
jgi:hypothetical protein